MICEQSTTLWNDNYEGNHDNNESLGGNDKNKVGNKTDGYDNNDNHDIHFDNYDDYNIHDRHINTKKIQHFK